MPVRSIALLIGFIVYAVLILGLLSLALLPNASANVKFTSLEFVLSLIFGLFPVSSLYIALSHIKLLKLAKQTYLPETFS